MEALTGIETPVDEMNADIHASAVYRAHLVGVMAKRAVAAASSKPVMPAKAGIHDFTAKP